jgi:filamentous hemagglutinin family protein
MEAAMQEQTRIVETEKEGLLPGGWRSYVGRRYGASLVSPFLMALVCVVHTAEAEVVTDGSVGPAMALTGPDFQIVEDLGTRSGSNLFHSFGQFSLSQEQSATFTGSGDIDHVISRVTGGQASSIDGLLKSEVGSADFWFINPAGVMFGANARVDVPAAFHASTAHEVRLADGAIFSAVDANGSGLTTAAPAAFGFLGPQNSPVNLEGSQIGVKAGQEMSLAGGEVVMNEATLTAEGGGLRLIGVEGVGEVSFPTDGEPQVADRSGQISLTDSRIDGSGPEGGRIQLQAANIELTDSTLSAHSTGDGDGRGIELQAEGEVSLVRSLLDSRSEGLGVAGAIRISGDRILIDSQNASGETGLLADAPTAFPVDLTVALEVEHGWLSDLDIRLMAESGDEVILLSGIGGSGANLVGTRLSDSADQPIIDGVAPFTGAYAPQQMLAAFDGQTVDGSWTLMVSNWGYSLGTLNGWSIELPDGQRFSANDTPIEIFDFTSLNSVIPIEGIGLTLGELVGQPGQAGDIQLNAGSSIEIQGQPALSATANQAGSISVSSPLILVDDVPGGLRQEDGVGYWSPFSDQIVLDGTLGADPRFLGPDFVIDEALGTRLDSNLFHSFARFNLDADESATFTGDDAIAHVINRVTGGDLSRIDGRLSSEIGDADLWFINPAGVMFGPNAQIDVPAAFHVATSQEVRMEDGSIFSVLEPGSGGLTSAAPEAFGFVGGATGPIRIDQTQWEGAEGGRLSLAAESIEIDGLRLTIPSGGLLLASVGSEEAVVPEGHAAPISANGELRLGDTQINLSGDGGGELIVRSGAATGERSSIFTDNTGDTSPGTNTIDWSSSELELRSTTLQSQAQGSGDSGNVRIEVAGPARMFDYSQILFKPTLAEGKLELIAESLKLDDAFIRGLIGHSSLTISVETQEQLALTYGGRIETINDGSIERNAGGRIEVKAGDLWIWGSNVDAAERSPYPMEVLEFIPSGLSTEAGVIYNIPNVGDAGDIHIDVDGLVRIEKDGLITSNSFYAHSPGEIQLLARQLEIDGGGIESRNGSAWLGSDSGSIDIQVSESIAINEGRISSATNGAGQGGDIRVTAQDLTMWGSTINSDTRSAFDGGRVSIDVTEQVALRDGSEISSSNEYNPNGFYFGESFETIIEGGSGNAGSVHVKAAELLIDGGGLSQRTGLFSSTDSQNSELTGPITGHAGDVVVSVTGSISLADGGAVSTSTGWVGNAGTILVDSGELVIEGGASEQQTGLFSATSSDGHAGTIDVTVAEQLQLMPGSEISSSAEAGSRGDAGVVRISTPHLLVDGGGEAGNTGIFSNVRSDEIEGPGLGDIGDVEVNAEMLSILGGGEIGIQNFGIGGGEAEHVLMVSGNTLRIDQGSISTQSTGDAAAGDIELLFTDQILLSDATVTTEANNGDGGAIFIDPKVVWLFNSQITTSVLGQSGDGGDITLIADNLILDGGFIQANTAAQGASGGLVQIDNQVLIPFAGELAVGGDERLAFTPGLNVIQAAAPDGVSGDIRISSPDVDEVSGLLTLETGFRDSAILDRNPCDSSADGNRLAWVGAGGLPWSIGEPLLSGPVAASFARSSGVTDFYGNNLRIAASCR